MEKSKAPSNRIRVAVVGFGYWGPNLARNFANSPEVDLRAICDLNSARTSRAGNTYPGAAVTCDTNQVLQDSEIDLVALATPVETHFSLGMAALKAGKHILVEKPLCLTRSQCQELIETADQAGKRIFCDHTFVFTSAVQKMKSLVLSGEIGRLLYYDSQRINLGIFRSDVDVTWDLVPHDFSILDFLLDGEMPTTVSCTGFSHFSDERANLTYVTLQYRNGFVAHVHASWLAPVKIRQILLSGDNKMIVYDENAVQEKIRIYDRGVSVLKQDEDVYKMLVQYREGDMYAPQLDNTEALRLQIDNIVDVLKNGAKAIVDGCAGMRVVYLLELASESMRNDGKPVTVSQSFVEASRGT